jgi:hypothetical protein
LIKKFKVDFDKSPNIIIELPICFSIFVLGTANKENSKAPTPEVKINSESDNEEVIKVTIFSYCKFVIICDKPIFLVDFWHWNNPRN